MRLGWPAVTALGAVVFLRDHLNRWTGLGLALAVAGVVVVNLGEDTGSGADLTTAALSVGSLLVFGAVCSEAAYTLLGKRLTTCPPCSRQRGRRAVAADLLALGRPGRDARSAD